MGWKTSGGTSGSDPTYLEPRVTAVEIRTNNMAKVPNRQTWIATEGQTDFTIDNGTISNVKLLDVYIGGVPQDEITLVSPTVFRVSEALSAGMKVFAEWFEVEIPMGQTHMSTHEAGGIDELDVTRLKNYSFIDDIGINLKALGAKGDGITDDTSVVQSIITNHRKVYVPNGTYKITLPLNVPPFTEVTFANGAVFDMSSLTNQNGFTTRVGSKFENVHLKYSNSFSGNGWYFTTIDNNSSTSVNNTDSNQYIAQNITIEKVMPTTETAWDWYTNATGTAFVMDGQDNPDVNIISGFWGGLVDNLLIKGVWLQSGLIKDDGVAWITSSTIRKVTIDGARRGFQIVSANTSAPKTGTLTMHDFHMQGMRWTKSGQFDVTTEWMLKAECTVYCDFKNFYPLDFSGTHLISNFIQFGANSKRCSFESPYIIKDTDIQDLGQNNKLVIPLGLKFPNLDVSTDSKTLDWYEEGNFTPSVFGGTTAGTCNYSAQSGSFVRIGKMVRISLEVGWSSHTGIGNLRVGGLPYTSSASDPASIFPVFSSSLTYGAGQIVGLLGKGTKNIDYFIDVNSDTSANVTIDPDVTFLRITGTYTV